MGDTIESYQGQTAKLAVTATDGRTDLYLRATVFNGNGSPVPVAAVNLDHKAIGFYRADVALNVPGVYRAVYRNFLDVDRTVLDTGREHDHDTILVRPLDVPRLGVAYDNENDVLLVEVTISRQGQPMPAGELLSAQVRVYDSDDNMIIDVSDLAPDSFGVFRLNKLAPGLVHDHLYYVLVRVTTTAGAVEANKGFHTTE